MFEHGLTRRTAVKAVELLNFDIVAGDGMTRQPNKPVEIKDPNKLVARRRVVDLPTRGFEETADDIKVGTGNNDSDLSVPNIMPSATLNAKLTTGTGLT
jgi:hypothetical protein